MRVPWIARKLNQSILKEISSGCSLKGLMLKLKLQYFGHLMYCLTVRGLADNPLALTAERVDDQRIQQLIRQHDYVMTL